MDRPSSTDGSAGTTTPLGDLTRWERALCTGRLLPPERRAGLTSLVSTETGQPLAQTSPALAVIETLVEQGAVTVTRQR